MAPHMITHCINDDTSFLQESRDIKYHLLYIHCESKKTGPVFLTHSVY